MVVMNLVTFLTMLRKELDFTVEIDITGKYFDKTYKVKFSAKQLKTVKSQIESKIANIEAEAN